MVKINQQDGRNRVKPIYVMKKRYKFKLHELNIDEVDGMDPQNLDNFVDITTKDRTLERRDNLLYETR